jgi:hypothetical protein
VQKLVVLVTISGVVLGIAGCEGQIGLGTDAAEPSVIEDAGAPIDAGSAPSVDAGEPPILEPGIAPHAFVPEAEPAQAENTVELGAAESAWYRVDVAAGEHVGLFLRFAPGDADVSMHVERYDAGAKHELGYTDGGRGIRTLALFEGTRGARTYFVRLDATDPLTGTLEVVRTPFEDGLECTSDCDRLLQLPLRVDAEDGYTWNSYLVMRYQFGRRDLLMIVRSAARALAAAGYAPIVLADFSQWDGATPGTDTGSLRHASHQRGKDVDISLYGEDGMSAFRSYCEIRYDSDPSGGSGRECVPGTVTNYDGRANAVFFGRMFANGRVTISFLDRELIPPTTAGSLDAIAGGELGEELTGELSSDGILSHWPNHDNHIHVRVSEDPYEGTAARSVDLSPP